MKRQALRQRLHALETLQDAVQAMRSLSAHHFRVVRSALPAGREYRAEIERIVSQIGVHQPLHPTAPNGLLVIASDLGLCGDYNNRLGQVAAAESRKLGQTVIYCVGRRLRSALSRSGLEAAHSYHAPASLDGMPQLLLHLAQQLLDDFISQRIGALHVVSARFDGIGHFTPLLTRVLPIEPVAGSKPVGITPYVEARHLAAVAVRELLYITLHEILLEAMASEQGMRLVSAESALEWLDDAIELARRRSAAQRNDAIMQELLDIVGGVKVRSLHG